MGACLAFLIGRGSHKKNINKKKHQATRPTSKLNTKGYDDANRIASGSFYCQHQSDQWRMQSISNRTLTP
jgi:hypothetical protein